jgi:peptidoglycan hydrolase-like protein with peptidoglycan-binding domain
LNEYEGAKLAINGVYEARDVEAVKRWQKKYRSYILDPMRLKEPTGTIYTLSMRQIERQTTASCGEPVIVTACPFFRANVKYGNRGEEVKKVQQFLNIVQGERLPLSGVFGPLTRDAVKRFQRSNRIYVATFIPISIATGNWYTTTRQKANETIGCDILN